MQKIGYVRNKKQKGIVVNALLRACDIPNTNVLLHLDGEDIAFCGIHQPPRKNVDSICSSFKMVECNCPFVAQGIFCKHVMKVKMLHKNIGDIGSIVKKINTLHKVTRGGVISKHNSPKCGLGDDDTKDDDPRNEQPR
jgi:hypothetical protein